VKPLWIWLPGWVIGDGFGDVRVGDRKQFAIELWFPESIERSEQCSSTLQESYDYTYDLCAKLIWQMKPRVEEHLLSIMQFGSLSGYHQDVTEQMPVLQLGAGVRSKASLGVDPYPYEDWMHKLSGIPPLIYQWQVEKITRDATPLRLVNGRYQLIEQREFVDISSTAEGPDAYDGTTPIRAADFVLHCQLLSPTPTHRPLPA
jgi:hypothetical protein